MSAFEVIADINERGVATRRRPHWGPLPKFAIALAAMLNERPVHGTSIQSGAQHDGRD
jgi:hypothetical protein